MLTQPVENDWLKTEAFISGQKVIYSPNDNVLSTHKTSIEAGNKWL